MVAEKLALLGYEKMAAEKHKNVNIWTSLAKIASCRPPVSLEVAKRLVRPGGGGKI